MGIRSSSGEESLVAIALTEKRVLLERLLVVRAERLVLVLERTVRLLVRVLLALVEWSLLVLLLTFVVLRRLALVLLRRLVSVAEFVWLAALLLWLVVLLLVRLVVLLLLRLLLEARRSAGVLRLAGRFSLLSLVRLVQIALDLLQLGNVSCGEKRITESVNTIWEGSEAIRLACRFSTE